ncbi:PKD domain-containing protein [Arthrospiribacter ruber]|uniref:Uncharacterized protein n=1 Tax=Arthrospiribacter ruber TaxID=2487934 RepID=A0A951IVY8_9BACT|nr:hypothetical protein [Arthrospiribacter ruber]MBW3466726.1 hypothetical protein [Arthrospiribacter ruber]
MKSFKNCLSFLLVFLVSFMFLSCQDEEESRPDSLSVVVANDFETSFGTEVDLDGSMTSDATGAPISYSWEPVSFPGSQFAPSVLDESNSPIAKFTPMEVGEFVFRLTATTEFESQSATIRVLVDAEIVELRGVINGENLTLGRTTPEGMPDYRVMNVVSFRESQITVLPGVEIEMTEGSGFNVEANSFLNMEGTEEEPILVYGAENTKGFWSSIRWASGSSNNKMIHVHLSDGGRNRNNDRGMITFANNGSLHMEDCRLSNSRNAALEIGIVTSRSGLDITHLNNDYKDNERAVFATAANFHFLDGGSDYSGNELNYIDSQLKQGTVPSGDQAWQKLNVPYQAGSIAVDGVLVIEAGAEIHMNNNSDIRVANGTLRVEGSEDDPVIIRAIDEGARKWRGIYITSSGNNAISHAELRETGSSALTSGASRAAVFVRNGNLSIDNILFADGDGYAYATWGAAPLIEVGENIRVENMALGETNMED